MDDLARARRRAGRAPAVTAAAMSAAGAPHARVPLAVVLALMRSGVAAGADVRSAMANVAVAVDGLHPDSQALAVIARRLGLGMSWADAWADAPQLWAPVERALRGAWRTGASPVGALDAAIAASNSRARSAGDRAAAELGVRLTLPLALCFLPAFVLVGIVPLLLTVAGGLAGTL